MTTNVEDGSKGFRFKQEEKEKEEHREPLEAVLLKALEAARLPGMTTADMIVCNEIYQCEHDEVPRHYEEVEYRMAKRHHGYSHAEASKALWYAKEHGFIQYALAIWGVGDPGAGNNIAWFPIADVVLNPQIYEILHDAERGVLDRDEAFVETVEWMNRMGMRR